MLTLIKELRDEIASLKGAINRKDAAYEEMVTTMSAKMAEMSATIASLEQRLRYYENPHSPPSKNSIPTMRRKAESMRGTSEAPARHKKAPGRKRGHAGISHTRKPERTVHHRLEKCTRCGSTELQYGSPISKIITDLDTMPQVITSNHLSYGATCHGCGHSEEPTVPGIPGTEFGSNLASVATCLHSMPASLGSVRTALTELFGIKMSKGALESCLQAVSENLEVEAAVIRDEIASSEFLNMDETTMAVDGRTCQVWIAVGRRGGRTNAVQVLVAGSRGGAVIDCHFPYEHIPITVDGYAPYASRFEVLQRCWSHILREARDLATKDVHCHRLYVHLKDIYYRSKILEPDALNTTQHEAMIEQVSEIVSGYDAGGHHFGKKLERALPNLFTFLLHPGMEPTNNLAERSLRPSVLARNVRHSLKTVAGMRMFGILMTCIMTWRARGQNVFQALRDRLFGTMDSYVGV